ncbi:MAG: metallophosphoesterase family protein [Verrucomicrobiota bacterium]
MRYAIFSDIHGNLPAWKQVLADIRDLEADVLICLGDVVGYGPKPQEVLDGIRSVTDHFVLGNHDAAAAGLIDPSIFNDHAHSVVLWTRKNLTADSLKFLRNVPLQLDTDDILFVHAEISDPGRFAYIDKIADAKANFANSDHFVTFIGHTHLPLIFEQLPDGSVNLLPDSKQKLDPKSRYIVNVGSVGEPRNPDDIRARYVIYDTDTREVFFRRIKFDTDIYRKELQSTTLTHSPYFLQVLDHASGLEAAKVQDMAVPSQAVDAFKTTQRIKLNIPKLDAAAKPKPKPISNRASATSSTTDSSATIEPTGSSHKKRNSLIIGSLAALVLCAWWFFSPHTETSTDEPLLTEKPLNLPSTHLKNEAPSPIRQDYESMSPVEKLYASEAPPSPDPAVTEANKTTAEKKVVEVPLKVEPKNMAKIAEPKFKSIPPPSPKTQPNPSPKPILKPKPAPPQLEIIAHWPMNSESAEGDLNTKNGGIQLQQLAPAKSFDKIAPDPLPQTSAANPSSLARGAWVEKNPSGKFALRPDSSFTFEGWVLISPDQAPVFIGGTQNNSDEKGWRLDLKSASTPDGSGSIRFLYSNGVDTITAQNNEIPLNQPTSHYFAAVWNHQSDNPNAGRLDLYFDDDLVDQTEIPYSEIATAESAASSPPFRLGSPDNPKRIAMDEFRFTKGELLPREFLSNPPGPIPGGVVTNSGLRRARLLYAVDDDNFDFTDEYTKDHSAEITSDSFTRVGYFVELGDDWVWVSMDRFQTDPKLLGVPKANTNIVEPGTVVTNLVIDSNRADLKALNRPGLTGIIEFWASNYSGNGAGEFGSSDSRYDWKDSKGTTQLGHGSFQVFAFTNDEQNAAVTLFGITRGRGAGIGDQSSDTADGKRAPDWTFGPGTKTYKKRNLEIFVGD